MTDFQAQVLDMISELKSQLRQCTDDIERLKSDVEILKNQNAELKQQLQINSNSSVKPHCQSAPEPKAQPSELSFDSVKIEIFEDAPPLEYDSDGNIVRIPLRKIKPITPLNVYPERMNSLTSQMHALLREHQEEAARKLILQGANPITRLDGVCFFQIKLIKKSALFCL